MSSMPEERRSKLRKLLHAKEFVRVMEASNGLTGLLVEKTKVDNKEYDAIWISSLCDSTLKGKPDNEEVDFTSRLRTIQEIMEVTTKPIIVDGDTGGRVEHFVSHIKTLECLGVSAIIIEDKKGLKRNSIYGNEVEQVLEDKNVFAEKIKRGKEALRTKDFMIFARIESFIADRNIEDAVERADCYVRAGADGIMIHSYKSDGAEVIAFLQQMKLHYPHIITVAVPTTYSTFYESQLRDYGANIVIYANHLLRSAYQAMKETAQLILKNERCYEATNDYCVSINELFQIVGDKND